MDDWQQSHSIQVALSFPPSSLSPPDVFLLFFFTFLFFQTVQCVTNPPCPSSKQAVDRSIVALKRHARDLMGQPRSSGDQMISDNAGASYLEEADMYKYDMLAIGRMIAQ
jgi:hypothetical protein